MCSVERMRVLIADDHHAVLNRIAALLSDEFLVVGTVTDGAQLVSAEAALRPDLLVVDICMPQMSGLEAATEIRRRGSQVPVVCLTSCSASDMLEEAWDAGALGYVAKATMVRDLVPAIRAALDGRRFVSDPVEPINGSKPVAPISGSK